MVMKTKPIRIAAVAFLLLVATNVSAGQSEVFIIKVADAISPGTAEFLSLIHISEPTRQVLVSRIPSSA